MTLATRRRSRAPVSEEAEAAARVVLGMTVAVGGVAAAIGAGSGGPIVMIVLPTLALLIAIMLGTVRVAGWAALAVWAIILPSAGDAGLLAPIAMIVLCLAIAIGPGRLSSWVGRDVMGVQRASDRSPAGWIEEDGGPVD